MSLTGAVACGCGRGRRRRRRGRGRRRRGRRRRRRRRRQRRRSVVQRDLPTQVNDPWEAAQFYYQKLLTSKVEMFVRFGSGENPSDAQREI